MLRSKSLIVVALSALLSVSIGAASLWAADTGASDAKKLSRAGNAKAVKKAKTLAGKKSVKKMESYAKKKKGRGYGADEDMALAMCGLTAEIGAQVMIDVSKGVPVSTSIEHVKAGEIFRVLPAELTGDPEFNKMFEQSVSDVHAEFSKNPEFTEQIKDTSPEELKFSLFLACIIN
jgi:hypothetical protein